MAHDHEHDDDHQHGSELSEMQLRVRALETVLAEKGYVDPAALDAMIEAYETKIGPHIGAQVVAKAWTDPAFKRALIEDATTAAQSLGLINRVGDHLIAVENTPKLHNMIVCTLCSCYPWEAARPAAGLVQIRAVSLPRGQRSARRARRFRRHASGRYANPRVGFDRRDALHRPADAPGRHRRLERRETRHIDHPRLHDRHRPAEASA